MADHTRALLKIYLPASILCNLRLETLEPCRETFLGANENLMAFVPDMQVILADLSQLSAESLPDIPALEARIRTLQLARRAQPPYESVVAIFTLLRGVPENDSKKDASNDIIWYLCKVFDAGKLEWFAQAIRTGLQLEPETPMPTIYEALIKQGVEQGIEKGIEKGVIIGRILNLQEVLQQPVASQEELVLLSHDELQLRAQQLQGLLRDRPA